MIGDGLLSSGGLEEALARLNARRRRRDSSDAARALERTLDLVFGTAGRLAVYGSLAPGESNHGQLRGLSGDWSGGVVRGELLDHGWGARSGFPAMRWDPRSTGEIPVRLFVSDDLPKHWHRLDAFEGDDYLRILVPVHRESRLVAVANIYELRTSET